jgi:hypothetical protein
MHDSVAVEVCHCFQPLAAARGCYYHAIDIVMRVSISVGRHGQRGQSHKFKGLTAWREGRARWCAGRPLFLTLVMGVEIEFKGIYTKTRFLEFELI